MPGATQKYISPVLTNAAVRFEPPGLVWDQLFVRRPVKKESGVYYVWDKSEFDAPDTKRANGAEANVTTSGFKEDYYFCQKQSLKEQITDDDRDNADDALQLEMRSTRLVKQQVMNGIERRVFGSSGIINTAANVGSTGTLDISNLLTASPRKAFDDAKNAIFVATGQEANVCFIGSDIARNIMRTDEYRQEFKFVTDIRNAPMPDEFYGLTAQYVGGLSTGAFKRGAAKTISRILGSKIFIAYIDPTEGDKILTYGKAMQEKEYAKKYRTEPTESDWIEYTIKLDLKVVAKECGYRVDVTPQA